MMPWPLEQQQPTINPRRQGGGRDGLVRAQFTPPTWGSEGCVRAQLTPPPDLGALWRLECHEPHYHAAVVAADGAGGALQAAGPAVRVHAWAQHQLLRVHQAAGGGHGAGLAWKRVDRGQGQRNEWKPHAHAFVLSWSCLQISRGRNPL